jgi:hypothetical protein
MNSGKTPNPSGFPEFLIKNRLSYTHLPQGPLLLLFKLLLPLCLALNCRTPVAKRLRSWALSRQAVLLYT